MPHIARMLVGPNFDRLLPAAMLLGAGYLLIVDTLARTIAVTEVPLGILTAFRRRAVFPVAPGARPGGLAMSLEVQDLAFGYRGKPVGRHASFRLGEGEVVCLLGPNGCGKTTLFKTILGLLAPQGGRVTIDGADLARWSRKRRAQTLAYVPQAHISFFPFRVLDTVLMGRTAHLGLFATPGRTRSGGGPPGVARPAHRAARRGRLHAHQRRPAPARADRARARSGAALSGHGRAHGQPRLRQPGDGARAGAAARRARHRRDHVDPRARPGVRLRRSGRF